MNDLVEFYRARLDEDEHLATAANAADPAPWTADANDRGSTNIFRAVHAGSGLIIAANGEALWDCEGSDTLCMSAPASRHAARHDPARVLREVGSKRILVAMHDEARKVAETAAAPDAQHYARLMMTAYASALRIMALAYADHPDYREEWRP